MTHKRYKKKKTTKHPTESQLIGQINRKARRAKAYLKHDSKWDSRQIRYAKRMGYRRAVQKMKRHRKWNREMPK